MKPSSDAWSWRKCVAELHVGAVRVEGDRLVVSGDVEPSAADFIRTHKAAIMEELRDAK